MWLERRLKNVRNLADEVEKYKKLDFFVCVVLNTRNKMVKQHIAGKILAMHCMSLLLKMFNFIVKRLPFSREVYWFPVVLLC